MRKVIDFFVYIGRLLSQRCTHCGSANTVWWSAHKCFCDDCNKSF